MDILKSIIGCCNRTATTDLSRFSYNCSFTYRKEQLSSGDFYSLSRSLREEMGMTDNLRPGVGFLPTLSELDEEMRIQVTIMDE